MHKVKLRLVLPIVQVFIALTCFVIGPVEYRKAAHHDGAVNNFEYYVQHWPSTAPRISTGLNFPAYVLSSPLHQFTIPLLEHPWRYGTIVIVARDVGFFVWIAVLWYFIGDRLDIHAGRRKRENWSRTAMISGNILIVAFSVVCGWFAWQLIRSDARPMQQIGWMGGIWSLFLLAHATAVLRRFVCYGRDPKVV